MQDVAMESLHPFHLQPIPLPHHSIYNISLYCKKFHVYLDSAIFRQRTLQLFTVNFILRNHFWYALDLMIFMSSVYLSQYRSSKVNKPQSLPWLTCVRPTWMHSCASAMTAPIFGTTESLFTYAALFVLTAWKLSSKPFIDTHSNIIRKMNNSKNKILLKSINPLITCNLCKGYIVDATAIIDCLHTCNLKQKFNQNKFNID